MVSDWKDIIMADVAAPHKNAIAGGPFGSNLVSSDYVDSGIPVIRGQNLGLGRWISGNFVFVTEDKAKSLSVNLARPGDIVFTQRGTLGQVAIIPETPFDTYLLSQSQMKVSVKNTTTDSLFVYYISSSQNQKDYIYRSAIQTGVPHINLGILKNIPLTVPPLHEQRAIAHVLGSLDDKIELNRKMNATLEQLARAIFKSWFVDFDPVRAKAAGRQPVGMDAATAALFPDSFETVDGREVPRRWEIHSLDSVASYLNGLALQKFPAEGNDFLPVIKIAQMRKGNTEGSDKASPDIPPQYIVEDGDVLFSWSGSLEVIIWCGRRGALNQHLFKVTSENYAKWFYYLWTKHHLPEFQFIAAGKVTTMGHIQRHHLTEAEVVVPTPPILKIADKTLGTLIDQIVANNLHSRTLATLRDSLLPKLLSGEIRVRDAEHWIETVS